MDAWFNLVNCSVTDNTVCVMLGDFKVDLLAINHLVYELSSTFGLKQHIRDLTRITSTTSTLLDHIYTSGLNNINAIVRVSYF